NIIFLALLGFIIIFAYIYPAIIGYDPSTSPYINVAAGENWNLSPADAMSRFGANLHWILGSGERGQSTFDYVWYGSSISISLAFICAAINMLIGVLLGAVWGFSKKFDIFMTELYNIVGNVPYVLVITVLVLILTASFWTMVFALTITGWLSIAYFIRTQVIIIRDREYNLASKCLGTSLVRIAMKNILPFMTSVIVTLLATEIPSYISMEVFLSFIGIGMDEMSLGKIIQEAQKNMAVAGRELEFWAPVVISSIITIVLYVVGQNLGDASDPRTHM
ncbi:MAG: ABC transporter permease, partial [Clostridia bacterium]|nr:ABC transporter permease [Clostridia bacterium]